VLEFSTARVSHSEAALQMMGRRVSAARLQLYEIGPPSCLKRVKFRTRLDEAQAASIHAELIRELAHATRLLASVSMELNAVRRNFPAGIPPPEATRTFQNASSALSVARKRMARAKNRLADYRDHGIVPEDLKQSG
jgi:hypothetical protein